MKKILAMTLITMFSIGLTGCGGNSTQTASNAGETSAQADNTAGETSAQADNTSSGNDGEVKKIKVGSGVAYKPYAYLDENGNAIGYEYDVLEAIDEALPQYEFEYDSMTFDNILLSLDAGKIDVAAHQYEYTPERAEKYLFSNESYTDYVTRFVVTSDNNDVNSIEDLAGKTVQAGGRASATYAILSKYNQQNPDKALNLLTDDSGTDEKTVTSLLSGAWAANTSIEREVDIINKDYGKGTDILKVVGEPINVTNTYYVFNKGDEELQQAFDEGLKTIKENGKLSEISIKWFGKDFSGSDGNEEADRTQSIAAKVGQ
jgi:L-cystine transport system substrate-binding protein